MRPRQLPVPWPVVWLFAEPRLGDALWAALARLPRGAGVVFGHAALAPGARRRLFASVRRVARARRLLLVDAADPRIAKAHGRAELIAARRRGARLVFVSPVFATNSHPGAAALGRVRFGLLARGAGVPVAALGGITAARFRTLRPLGAVAWGAIDAWTWLSLACHSGVRRNDKQRGVRS